MGKTRKKEAKVHSPGEGNPFETVDKKSKKNGKKKMKNGREGQEYPDEINPFQMKPTKSMKKRDKEEKKRMKDEKKIEKKERKLKKKQEKISEGGKTKKNIEPMVVKEVEVKSDGESRENNNHHSCEPIIPPLANTSSTLPPVQNTEMDSPSVNVGEKQISKTPDLRTPAQPAPASPQLPNKRILQLKTGRETLPVGRNMTSSSPESGRKTNYKYSPTPPKSASPLKEGPVAFRATSKSENPRPRSLDLKIGAHVSDRGLSPVQEYRTPSPLVSRPGAEDVKMYRTSSISKKGKDKKKKRKLKRILKKKKKSKTGKQTNLLDDRDVTGQVVMRRPKVNNIETLQKQVVEVQESARSSIINLVEQRNSALDKLTENTKELEEFSLGFATVAQEARLKNQARVTCCGIGKNWKFCWYLCACERGIKKKKKGQMGKNSKGQPESHELLSGRHHEYDDDDDYYRPAVKKAGEPESGSEGGLPPRTISGQESKTTHSLDSDNNAAPSTFRSKLANIPKAIRGSMPSLLDDTPPMGRSLRSMANVDPRERKSSSVSALHEIVKKRGEKKREEKEKKARSKQEKDIENFASQYDDEETRKKVEDLLRLDL